MQRRIADPSQSELPCPDVEFGTEASVGLFLWIESCYELNVCDPPNSYVEV